MTERDELLSRPICRQCGGLVANPPNKHGNIYCADRSCGHMMDTISNVITDMACRSVTTRPAAMKLFALLPTQPVPGEPYPIGHALHVSAPAAAANAKIEREFAKIRHRGIFIERQLQGDGSRKYVCHTGISYYVPEKFGSQGEAKAAIDAKIAGKA